MQENEFEKQVRKMMDDMEIMPSAPVWDYVEKRIPKSNRRRRFVAFFLLLAGLAVCGYFFYNKFSGGTDKNNTTKITTKQADAALEHKAADAANNSSKITREDALSGKDNVIASDEPATLTKSKMQQSTLLPDAVIIKPAAQEKENKKESSIDLPAITKKEIPNVTEADATVPMVLNDNNTATIKDEAITKQSESDAINATITEKQDTAASEKPNTKDTLQQNAEAKKLPIIHTAKKLQWGISAFYGKSDAVETRGFLGLSGILEENKSLDAANYQSGAGSPWDSISYEKQSKAIVAKSSFALGLSVRKPISARSSITAGIEYTQRKTEIKTGAVADSTAVFYYNNTAASTRLENFYRPGTSGKQTNTYHLIQLPVWYSYQLNKGLKFPMRIDAGVSFAQIISSNALVYDSYNQAYYKNNDLLYKTQVSFLGGLHTAFNVGKNSLHIGPQFQYSLTGLVKNSNSNQRFFVWGLHARYFLKK